MIKGRMSLKKCQRQTVNNKKNNQEKDPEPKTMRSNNEIGDSSRTSPVSDTKVSGHSTPIREKDYVCNVEDSPEIGYCSPIFLPYTQENGNEVAWDWQTSKGAKETDNKSICLETPKRKKLLQKKRDSNSPLLQKPLRRKQYKIDHMEGIGKLTAELKALTEKMSNVKPNGDTAIVAAADNRELTLKTSEPETQLVIEIDDCTFDDNITQMDIQEDKQNIKTVKTNSGSKRDSSYEDFFDDSVNESMVKCSQEVEEKYLGKINSSSGAGLPPINEELRSTSQGTTLCSTLSNHSTDISGNSSISKSALTVNLTHCLKTYSKNPGKTSSIFDNHVPSLKDQNVQNTHSNNNVIKKCTKSTSLDANKTGLFEIPDDSFDDCLATCFEEEDKSTGHNVIFTDTHNSAYLGSVKCHDSVLKNEDDTITSSSSNTIENRKFFKTKNLMDQYLRQGKNINTNSKPSRTIISRHLSDNSILQFPSRSTGSSVVTTAFPCTENRTTSTNNNILENNRAENMHPLNRSIGKEGGTRIIKHKSTSSLCINKKNVVQCTPAEIERKRLEAKIKLEAKRKLQQSLKTNNTQRELSVKGHVKR